MYIIIVGGGNVGYHLARALLREGHEVLIIDKDPEKCQRIEEELGEICLVGDGCEVSVQEKAGAERADMLIAVTNEDEDNLVSCQVAKYRFGVTRTIARVGNPQYEELFRRLGVDTTVSSTRLILEHIEQEVPTHPITHLLEEEKLSVMWIKVLPDSESVGRRVKDLTLPPGSVLALIIRQDQPPIIPTPDTLIQAGDRVLVVAPPHEEVDLGTSFLGETEVRQGE